MNIITSKNNPQIVAAAKLHSAKNRNAEMLFLIEGEKIIEMALGTDCVIKNIFIDVDKNTNFSHLIKLAAEKKINIVYAKDMVIDKLSTGKSPQGIVAETEYINYKEDVIGDLIIACESLADPGNIGTIIRTADAAGVKTLILSDDCVDIYNDKVIRASMGSIFNVNIITTNDFRALIEQLREQGYSSSCGHLEGEDFFCRKQSKKNILIIGNESRGVSSDTAKLCDFKWKIPMYGKAESFNAAVAAGIMIYDIVRSGNRN